MAWMSSQTLAWLSCYKPICPFGNLGIDFYGVEADDQSGLWINHGVGVRGLILSRVDPCPFYNQNMWIMQPENQIPS